MIQTDYVLLLARYNAWQNNQLRDALTGVDDAVLTTDRGAFFGTILRTLSHLLWGDAIWMSRLTDAVCAPDVPGAQSVSYTSSGPDWALRRQLMDQQIIDWAHSVTQANLGGEESWYSGATQRDMVQPRWLCVTHMFNHQTHHRGQVSQMLHAAGLTPPVSDIIFMPKDF